MNFKQFGGNVTPKHIEQYSQSTNWKGGSFQNLDETVVNTSLSAIPAILYKQITNKKHKSPTKPIPVLPFDRKSFMADSPKAKFIWYGHSVLLMRMNGKTILIDPMLGHDTTPIAPMTTRRFSENTIDLIDDFPEIDLMVITHDHYDHLDFASIQKLKGKTKQYFVSMGTKRHLVSWGIDAGLITEFDWWDKKHFYGIDITFTPTKHFSGRGLRDRMKCLWGGWVFVNGEEKIWFSGDGGYGHHFKIIGEKFGGFDLAFMECGQYNDDWHYIHLFPDECVRAALDGLVAKAVPVHWGGFALSYQHHWYEPVEDFLAIADLHALPVLLPPIGKIFTSEDTERNPWWEDYK